MIKHISLFLILLFFCGSGFSQNVSATVDKQEILIGEQLTLTIQATLPAGLNNRWIEFDSLPHFEVLQKEKIDTAQSGNNILLTQKILLTSWDSGSRQIPSFSINNFSTTPIPVEVSYTPFDPQQEYHDIKDVIDVPKPDRPYWIWFLVVLLLLIGLFLLIFPKKKKPAPGVFVPDEGVYKQSLKKLEKLKQNKEIDAKAYYTELVDVFRNYLSKRKGIRSYSRTTDDLAVQLSNLNLSSDVYHPMVQTLKQSDLVKFAKYQPTEEEKETSIDIIKQSIISIENKT